MVFVVIDLLLTSWSTGASIKTLLLLQEHGFCCNKPLTDLLNSWFFTQYSPITTITLFLLQYASSIPLEQLILHTILSHCYSNMVFVVIVSNRLSSSSMHSIIIHIIQLRQDSGCYIAWNIDLNTFFKQYSPIATKTMPVFLYYPADRFISPNW